MKTGGSERKMAWGGCVCVEDGTVDTMLVFDFKGWSRPGVIGCMETTGALPLLCRPGTR